MFGLASASALALALAFAACAAATPTLYPRTATQLTSSQLAAFAPYTQLARAAYCQPTKLTNWNCGEACDAVPGVEIALAGGDGNAVQFYYVGHWPDQDAVVIGHQGTDPTQFLSDLTDLNIAMSAPDASLFPGVPAGVQAHSGFLAEHARTAPVILAQTKALLAGTGATNVIVVGHSLGGALAELDALFMALNLPTSVHVKAVTYGTPRVGNPAFAAFFDSQVADFTRVNHASDPIPIVPGRLLGFAHPHGEVHLLASGVAVACAGDDDATDALCTDQSVPNVVQSDLLDHLGPYEGVFIGTVFCV